MIRFIPILILFLVALTFSGCHGRSASSTRLDLAESLMWSMPDSALSVLGTVSPDSLAKGEERARYALLLTMAMDKNYLKPTNDSLISSAVDYYNSKNNAGCLMVANYYRGRVQQHNGRYPQALLSFYQAKELAEKNDSSFWAGMACRGISDIYGENYNRAEELTFAKKEYEYIKKSGRQPYLNYALHDLGRAYGNNDRNDKAISISEQLIDSAIISKDAYLFYGANQLKSYALISDKQYSEAYPLLLELSDGGFAEEMDSLNLSLVLAHIGMKEKALRLLDNLPNANSGAKSSIRYVIYRNAAQYDKAIGEVEYVDSASDSILRTSMSRNLTGFLSDYFEMNKKITEAELNATKLQRWLLIVGFMVTTTLLIYVIVHIYRRQKHEISKKVLLAEQLEKDLGKAIEDLGINRENLNKIKEEFGKTREELSKKTNDLNKINEDLCQTKETLDKTKEILTQSEKDLDYTRQTLNRTKEEFATGMKELDRANENLIRSRNERERTDSIIGYLTSTKYELLEQLAKIKLCSKDAKVVRRKIADAVTRLIDDLSFQSDKVIELGNEVDTLHDNLFSDFRADLPDLKDADYRLFLFSVLRFSIPTVSLFLKEDKIDAVYNRKRRLKDKIKLLGQEKGSRYLPYL
ncbi:MAG: hypothetical protein HDR88_18755 [Bacteroides sp.]|nr:hypothetical protein [Bacteroides sp.]